MKRVNYDSAQFAATSTKGIYDKVDDSKPFPFEFLKFEAARSDYLIKKGVHTVVQSWKNRGSVKTLYTGLIPLRGHYEIFYGDNLNKKGKKDFLIVVNDDLLFTVYLFKDRNPRNKTKFSIDFLNSL